MKTYTLHDTPKVLDALLDTFFLHRVLSSGKKNGQELTGKILSDI